MLASAIAVVIAAAALFFTWTRLFVGVDLLTESYYVLVPWRWVLGARPFVQDQNVLQMAGLLEYPFLKLFGVLRGSDPTGLMLYTRHLYLLLMVAVASSVLLVVRRLVCWQLALVIASVVVTYVHWATPQLSYNTMGIAFLTLGSTLGVGVVVLGRGRGHAMGSGAAFGCAVVAYPTLVFVVPILMAFFVVSQGRQATAMLARSAVDRPAGAGRPQAVGSAWRMFGAWVFGGAIVLVPVGLLLVSFGVQNVRESITATASGTDATGQLGGTQKVTAIAQGVWGLLKWHPEVFVALLLVYLAYRHRPRLGRALLCGVPFVLWLAAQRSALEAEGYVCVYVLLTPYLYLFVPRQMREAGARLLLWVWAPALAAGAVTAYSSAFGLRNAAIGLSPALVVSGLFLAWALGVAGGSEPRESDGRGLGPAHPPVRSTPWLALAVLAAVVAVTVSFQFQFQRGALRYDVITSRFSAGPWAGIKAEPTRRELMDDFAADLHAQARPGDKLLVFYSGVGYYLYWTGTIATDSYWLLPVEGAPTLPPATVASFRRARVVPTLVVRLMRTEGLNAGQIADGAGGLGYPAVLVQPDYVIYRKPAGETAAEVLARLPLR